MMRAIVFTVGTALYAACAVYAAPAAAERRVPLADASLAATERGRMNLKYLASCALDRETVLVAETPDGTFEFPGGMALAPDWVRRPLSAAEERWVSACILARTNYFGVKVQISQRSPFPTDAHGLQWDAAEASEYPLAEATFFGNIFQGAGERYVCAASPDPAQLVRAAAHRRVCALPVGQDPTGRPVTPCGMTFVGACTAASFTQNDVVYREAISVYLPEIPRTE